MKLLATASVMLGFTYLLQGCNPGYVLAKYYRDASSPAAQMMGGTYAGEVETFDSLDACLEMKAEVEKDDCNIGYTNSRFECEKK